MRSVGVVGESLPLRAPWWVRLRRWWRGNPDLSEEVESLRESVRLIEGERAYYRDQWQSCLGVARKAESRANHNHYAAESLRDQLATETSRHMQIEAELQRKLEAATQRAMDADRVERWAKRARVSLVTAERAKGARRLEAIRDAQRWLARGLE